MERAFTVLRGYARRLHRRFRTLPPAAFLTRPPHRGSRSVRPPPHRGGGRTWREDGRPPSTVSPRAVLRGGGTGGNTPSGKCREDGGWSRALHRCGSGRASIFRLGGREPGGEELPVPDTVAVPSSLLGA
jgi:hypothetical protein